jgi:hypothetical protein
MPSGGELAQLLRAKIRRQAQNGSSLHTTEYERATSIKIQWPAFAAALTIRQLIYIRRGKQI